MNSRERIIETLNHRQPDKLAIDFGGMRSTGISAIAYNNLRKHLRLPVNNTKVYDIFQQLAEPQQDILDYFNADVVQLHRLSPSFGITIKEYKPWKLSDDSDCFVPVGYNPKKNDDGELEIWDKNTLMAKMPKNGYYFDLVYQPYKNVKSFDDIDKVPIAEISKEELDYLEIEAKKLYTQTNRAILGAFGGNILEAGQSSWGFEKFYLEMYLNPELVHYYLDKITNAYIRDLQKYLGRVGKYINIIQMGDDLGTQQAPQLSLDMYREFIKPYHKRIYTYVRNNYPNVKVFLHSCGAIFDLIPDLIDAGVEILNPVQISANGMDPIKLKKEFGNQLVFWGGGANMQYTAMQPDINILKKEVKELIEIFSKGGGYVFNQVHNIQENVAPEKVVAIYETAKEFRNKKIKE